MYVAKVLAPSLTDSTYVAIKQIALLPEGSPKITSLAKEVELTKKVRHENILTMQSSYVDIAAEDEYSLWIRMELMDRSLADILNLADEGVTMAEVHIAQVAKDVGTQLRSFDRDLIFWPGIVRAQLSAETWYRPQRYQVRQPACDSARYRQTSRLLQRSQGTAGGARAIRRCGRALLAGASTVCLDLFPAGILIVGSDYRPPKCACTYLSLLDIHVHTDNIITVDHTML